MARAMPGIRPAITVLFSKSCMKQYLGVICGDLPCSELEQLLFLHWFGCGRGAPGESCAMCVLSVTFALAFSGLSSSVVGKARCWGAGERREACFEQLSYFGIIP